jgi:hypothetical protein
MILERKGLAAAKAVEGLKHLSRTPIGFLMVRGISETRDPRKPADTEAGEQRDQRKACAARDAADFTVELIRKRWPVASRANG